MLLGINGTNIWRTNEFNTLLSKSIQTFETKAENSQSTYKALL